METDLYIKIVKLNTLGQKHLRTKNYSSCIICLKSAEELITFPFIPYHYKSLTYFNLAAYYLALGKRQKSIKYLEKVLKIAQDNPTLAKAHLNIGHIYSLQGYHQKSLYQNLKALKYLENTKEWEGMITAYHSIGQEYQHLNQFSKCLRFFKEGLFLSKQNLGINHRLTKLLRNCYLKETRSIVFINHKKKFESFKFNNNELGKIVSELENPIRKFFTPLPKSFRSKNNSPSPNPNLLRTSLQSDFYHKLNKGTQSDLDDYKIGSNTKTSWVKLRTRSSFDKFSGLKPVPAKSKIYLENPKKVVVHDFHDLATKLQKNIKKWLFSSKFQKLRRSAIKIQKTWKMLKQRKNYNSIIKKVIKIQSFYRGRRVRKLYNFLLNNKSNNILK